MNKVVGRINSRIKRIKKDELSRYLTMMYDFVDDDNSLENVSAALLKMVVEGEDRPKRFPKRFPRRY